jgi:hypothetical protein
MGVFESFKKDWSKTKEEMRKLGEEKPAEVKNCNLLIVKFEKRVSSGIGDALKGLDKAKSKDAKAYKSALADATKAINAELDAIEKDVQKTLNDKGLKDGHYRALKVFKSKLMHYLAAAEQEYREMKSSGNDADGTKTVKLFKAKSKQLLFGAVATLKKLNATPTKANYQVCHDEVVEAFGKIDNALEKIPKELYDKAQGPKFHDLYTRTWKLPRAQNCSDTPAEIIQEAKQYFAPLLKSGITLNGSIQA